jgi:hypothetical protein
MSINVRNKKLRLGLIYGMIAGSSFALFTWGFDAWQLARAHAAFYWTKLLPGLIICLLAGGLVGWLTILIERHGPAMALWALLGALFTWLAIWLPMTGSPGIIRYLDPTISGWFDFSRVQSLDQINIISLLVIGVVAIIGGLLEINLITQAILSPYVIGSLGALVVCIVLFGLGGSAIDHMINSNFREPLQVVNELLQFAQENAGVDVPKSTARAMHLSSARHLGNLIQDPRRLFLIGYNEDLGIMDILVDFNGTPVKCTTIYSQPTDCVILSANP